MAPPISAERREAAVTMLRAGQSVTAIGRALRMDRVAIRSMRNALGLPVATAPSAVTLDEMWAAFTRPLDGGHIEWTGLRTSANNTPIMRTPGVTHTVNRYAFRLRHGRDPEGPVTVECGLSHCVAPDHLDDTAGRTRDRAALRLVVYRTAESAPFCRRAGHDQSIHGRFETDGRAYCRACKNEQRALIPAAATPPEA